SSARQQRKTSRGGSSPKIRRGFGKHRKTEIFGRTARQCRTGLQADFGNSRRRQKRAARTKYEPCRTEPDAFDARDRRRKCRDKSARTEKSDGFGGEHAAQIKRRF